MQRLASYTLIKQEARILLCRLANLERNVGKWTLPGGGLEFGEHPEQAALRETREETGLAVRLTGLAAIQSQVFEFPDCTMHALRFIYFAEATGGTQRNEENGTTDQCAWFSLDEARGLPLVELAEEGLRLAFGLS
jgi:ADP-ribose pyrophosphatase YjhB (NUDIX family)